MKNILLIAFLLSANLADAASTDLENSDVLTGSCGTRLETSVDQKAKEFRAEIKAASAKYAAAHPDDAWSMLRGDESQALAIPTAGHMIYLASGADVYRPLFDFPLIQHYHLVDGLARWGSSPQYFIFEVTRRLKELSPTSKVTIVQRGFLDFISTEELSKSYREGNHKEFENEILSRPHTDNPLVLLVEVESPTVGLQNKYFYIHPVDFHHKMKMTSLLNSIPVDESLVGVLEAGYSNLPSSDVFHMLMDRLSDKGHFIFEYWKTINFDPKEMIAETESAIGSQYNIQLTLPDRETQEKMAATDMLQKNRISFEILMSRKP